MLKYVKDVIRSCGRSKKTPTPWLKSPSSSSDSPMSGPTIKSVAMHAAAAAGGESRDAPDSSRSLFRSGDDPLLFQTPNDEGLFAQLSGGAHMGDRIEMLDEDELRVEMNNRSKGGRA